MKNVAIALSLLLTLSCSQTESPHYQVFAVSFTENIRENGRWISNRDAPDSIDMRFMVWLIQGGKKNVLVDAGYRMSDSARLVDQTGYTRPDSALLGFGVRPEDVTDIIISHTHWDHINGIGLFPNATIWMQQDDFDYFVGPVWSSGNTYGYSREDAERVAALHRAGRVKLVKGDSLEIMEGIRVFIGSKHTYESQYVQVTAGDERIILASDNIWFYHNYDNLLSASITFDTAAYIHQMKRMKTLASSERLIIPGHDAKIFERFPEVSAGVVRLSGN